MIIDDEDFPFLSQTSELVVFCGNCRKIFLLLEGDKVYACKQLLPSGSGR